MRSLKESGRGKNRGPLTSELIVAETDALQLGHVDQRGQGPLEAIVGDINGVQHLQYANLRRHVAPELVALQVDVLNRRERRPHRGIQRKLPGQARPGQGSAGSTAMSGSSDCCTQVDVPLCFMSRKPRAVRQAKAFA